jgi:oligopeptide transport system substrate-binding protein
MAALGLVALTLGCSPTGKEEAAAPRASGPPGILNRGTASEPPTLDPHLAFGNSSSVIIDDLFIGLMTTDASGKIQPGLAESYTMSADGLSYTFKLRPGLKWSDGAPLTSADVVYSFQRLLDPKTAARYATNLYMIAGAAPYNQGKAPAQALGVRAAGPDTVVFTLARKTPYFAKVLQANSTVIVPRQAIEAHGQAWTQPGKIVVNGAFALTEWVPNTTIRLAKNAAFYDAANVKLNEVVYFPTDDLGTQFRRYRAGELDIVLNFPPDQLEFIQKNFAADLRQAPGDGLFYFVFNTRVAPFDDARVRRALSVAVDREAIVEKILRGAGAPAYNIAPPGFAGYAPAASPFAAMPQEKRLEQARAWLKEAGYGPDKPLKFTLRYDSKEESRQIAVALTSMWTALGVEATAEASDFRAITGDARSGKFQLLRYQYFAPFDDPSTFLSIIRSKGAINYSGYTNPAVDGLLAKADEAATEAERVALLAQAEAIAKRDAPVMPIFFPLSRRLVAPRVVGWPEGAGNVQSRWLSTAN